MSDPTKPGLSIDVTEAPTGPAHEAVAAAAQTPEGREALVCYDLLDGKAQGKAEKEAEGMFPQLFESTELLKTFGNEVLEPLNKLVDDSARDVPPVEIPQLTGLMTTLHSDMKKLSGKYDMANPKVMKWLHDSLEGVKGAGGWFGAGKSIFEELLFDAKNLYQKLDTVKATVYPKELAATKNVGLLDNFYHVNEKEILALIYKIAVMEQIQTLATNAAKNIKADANKTADHDQVEQKRLLTEFANNMALKIAEFKNRLFLGWANGPQLTNKRTLNLSLAIRLNMITNVSLPSVKFAVEQWEIALQEQQMAHLIELTDTFDNAVMQEAAKAGAEIAAYIADVTQTPSLRPETIKMIADSIAAQADATAKAYLTGLERRKASDDAIVKGQRVIANSQMKVSDTFLNQMMNSASKATEASTAEQNELLALAKKVPTAA